MLAGVSQNVAFTTTQWTRVLAAKQVGTPGADIALEELCRAYWYPLYAFIRRQGWSPEEAQDLTQEFFARLLRNDSFRGVDRRKGKFRSFLLAALEHFLANQRRRSKTQKRGGAFQFISLDDSAEQQYKQLAADYLSPEKLYARQWATTLLEHVHNRLRDRFVASGNGELFEKIKVFLAEIRPVPYTELGKGLNLSEAAVKMAVKRLRHRYRMLLREEIAKTVSGPAEIDQELRELFAALGP